MTHDYFDPLRKLAQDRPESVAFSTIEDDGGETFTYSQVWREIQRVSLFLRKEAGIRPGERIGILMENHPRWGIAYLAGQSAGAVVVPFDVLHTPRTLASLMRHSGCRLIVASQSQGERLAEIFSLLERPLPVLTTGVQCGDDWTSWSRLTASPPDRDVPVPLAARDPGDPLSIMYTSGTTGDPKGVVLSERAIYSNVQGALERIDCSHDDKILSVLPLYHALALMANFLVPLHVGGQVAYLATIEPQRILRAFRDEGITIFVAVPQFFNLVHRRIFQEIDNQSWIKRWIFRRLLGISRTMGRRFHMNLGRRLFPAIHRPFGDRLRLFGVGGARFDARVARDFRDLGFTIIQAYGMTESAAVATLTPLTSRAVGSVGTTLPHTRIRIDSPDPDGTGEVWIGGDSLMNGYWENPQATAEILRGGWLHTGDLGRLSPDGLLEITGRMKDVIVLSSGKNIFPQEIEDHYQSEIDYIREICVVGLADEGDIAERLHAVIVPDFDRLRKEQIVNAADMIRYMVENASQALPTYKRVRSFELHQDPLPRTTTRKLKRFEVQKLARAEGGQVPQTRTPPPAGEQTPVEKRIIALIERTKGISGVHGGMNLEIDVGFDSLERVEFLSTIQEVFGVHLSDDDAAEIFTVAHLVEAVQKRVSGEIEESGKEGASWPEILSRTLSEDDAERLAQVIHSSAFWEHVTRLVGIAMRLLGKLLFKLRFEGVENLPPDPPYLICPNHLSYLDAPLVAAGLPFAILRRCFYLGYADYFSGPVMGRVGRIFRIVPVNPDRHLRQALRLGAEGLRQNRVLCVFPEGERSIDGKVKPFRKGPAILAKSLNLRVVPVGIVGTYEAWPRTGRLRPHPVRIRFGEPLDAPTASETVQECNRRIFEAVKELLEERSEDRP